jgi:hypothetical protein
MRGLLQKHLVLGLMALVCAGSHGLAQTHRPPEQKQTAPGQEHRPAPSVRQQYPSFGSNPPGCTQISSQITYGKAFIGVTCTRPVCVCSALVCRTWRGIQYRQVRCQMAPQ